ncbi:hypothetical protein C8Q77DRAFT_499978 [Trametes polyzona]|nr:hypothetical protein C8Q77DRAFT_499978 [Trametes polyzona]
MIFKSPDLGSTSLSAYLGSPRPRNLGRSINEFARGTPHTGPASSKIRTPLLSRRARRGVSAARRHPHAAGAWATGGMMNCDTPDGGGRGRTMPAARASGLSRRTHRTCGMHGAAPPLVPYRTRHARRCLSFFWASAGTLPAKMSLPLHPQPILPQQRHQLPHMHDSTCRIRRCTGRGAVRAICSSRRDHPHAATAQSQDVANKHTQAPAHGTKMEKQKALRLFLRDISPHLARVTRAESPVPWGARSRLSSGHDAASLSLQSGVDHRQGTVMVTPSRYRGLSHRPRALQCQRSRPLRATRDPGRGVGPLSGFSARGGRPTMPRLVGRVVCLTLTSTLCMRH